MTSLDETQPIFRIAIRAEGPWINAYFAAPDSMTDAQLIGSVRRAICDASPAVFAQFRELMQAAITVMTQQVLGVTPVNFVTEPAPEHERAGNS